MKRAPESEAKSAEPGLRIRGLVGATVCGLLGVATIVVLIAQYDRIAYCESYAELSLSEVWNGPAPPPSFVLVRVKRWSWLPGTRAIRERVSRERFEHVIAEYTSYGGMGIGCGPGGSTTAYRFDRYCDGILGPLGDRAHERIETVLARRLSHSP